MFFDCACNEDVVVKGLKNFHFGKMNGKNGEDLSFPSPPQAVFVHYKNEAKKERALSIFPRPDGNVYICGSNVNQDLPDDPEDVQPNPDTVRMLKKHLNKILDFQDETIFGAHFPMTSGFKPVMGEIPNYPGAYIAGGHGWWGILASPASGLAMACLILGKKEPPINMTPFKPNQFGLW